MPRLKLILNPQADHGHAAETGSRLRNVVEEQIRRREQSGQSYDLSWVSTEGPRHAIELAREAAQQGFDTVVAVGGDGTVHEVVNGLMQMEQEKRPRLGVIPIGSGNDFAHNVGLPSDPLEAVRCTLGDHTRTVDVGLIVDETGRREYWDNTIGIGFSGQVNIATRGKTRWRGFMLYLISVLETILFKPPALNATVQFDAKPPVAKSFSMLSICNGPREGGGFPVNPGAVMDDGLITYTVMRKMSRFNMLRMLPIVMKGRHLSLTRFFEAGTAQSIRVETDRTMAIHTDGEVFGPWEAGIRQVEASIVSAAVRVVWNCQGG